MSENRSMSAILPRPFINAEIEHLGGVQSSLWWALSQLGHIPDIKILKHRALLPVGQVKRQIRIIRRDRTGRAEAPDTPRPIQLYFYSSAHRSKADFT